MLTRDVRFEGWTTEDWSRLLGLFQGPPDPAAGDARGGLLVIHSGGRVRKMLHTQRGRVDKESQAWPAPLPALAAAHGARWVLAAPTGGLENLAERFGARARREDNLAVQARLLLDIFRELLAEGIIDLFPNRMDRVSIPTAPPFGHTLEALFPAGQLVLLALFHDGELFTSIALERSQGGINRIAGPDDLRPRLSFLSGDFRRDFRYALDAAEDVLGPIALGFFSEVAIFRDLQASRSWKAWLRAFAVRDVIVTTPQGSLVTPLAADAAAFLGSAVASLGKRWEGLPDWLSRWPKWR